MHKEAFRVEKQVAVSGRMSEIKERLARELEEVVRKDRYYITMTFSRYSGKAQLKLKFYSSRVDDGCKMVYAKPAEPEKVAEAVKGGPRPLIDLLRSGIAFNEIIEASKKGLVKLVAGGEEVKLDVNNGLSEVDRILKLIGYLAEGKAKGTILREVSVMLRDAEVKAEEKRVEHAGLVEEQLDPFISLLMDEDVRMMLILMNDKMVTPLSLAGSIGLEDTNKAVKLASCLAALGILKKVANGLKEQSSLYEVVDERKLEAVKMLAHVLECYVSGRIEAMFEKAPRTILDAAKLYGKKRIGNIMVPEV